MPVQAAKTAGRGRGPWSRLLGILIFISILAGTVGAVPVLVWRLVVEHDNNSVELTADWQEFEALALREGYSVEEMMQLLADSGVTSLAIQEMTPERLMRSGKATLWSGADLLATYWGLGQAAARVIAVAVEDNIDPGATYMLFSDQDIFQRTYEAACGLLNEACRTWSDGGLWLLEVRVPLERFRRLGLGIWPEELELARRYGFSVVPRFLDHPNLTPVDVEAAFQQVTEIVPVSSVVFSGDAVMGANAGGDVLEETARQLNERNLPVGLIESPELLGHIPQQGMERLLELVDYRAARLYSIPVDYLANLHPDEVVDVWVRSPQERNIRILYLRPLYNGGTESIPGGDGSETRLLDITAFYLRQLKDRLLAKGWRVGPAGVFPSYSIPTVNVILMFAAAGGLAVLLLARIASWQWWWLPLLWVGASGGMVALYNVVDQHTAREVAALMLAVVAPVLAMDIVLVRWARRTAEANTGWVVRSVADTLLAALVMVGASLLLAAILGDTRYLLELRYFRGVKLSFLLPPLLVFLLYWWRLGFGDGHPDTEVPKEQLFQRRIIDLVSVLRDAVRWHHVLLGIVLAVAAAVYVIRSGNITQEYVPSYELYLRQLLEDLLIARPRFKEFVLGYPSLLLGGWLLTKRLRAFGWLPAVGGTVGMVSIINSFEHIRTPVWVSFLRVINGLWLGLLIGLLLVLTVELCWRYGAKVWQSWLAGERSAHR